MKKITFAFILITIFASFAQAANYNVKESITSKGIKFWQIEDNYLPIVSLKIIFAKSGSAYDPVNKQGLANMTAGLLVEGAGGISGVEFMQQLEGLASNISFSADEDSFSVSLTCLKENLDESLRLLSLAINSPDFTPDAIQRVRKSILTSIARQDESPEGRAQKAFKENFFAGHPYSRQVEGTATDVNSIEKKDLSSFSKRHFTQGNMFIGVAGSVTPKYMATLLDKHLASLPKDMGEITQLPEFVPSSNLGRVIKIEQDVPQSVVIFGFVGPKRKDVDFYNTYVMNHLLGGGGFESRLMHEVREKHGLAYTVYTSVQTYAKTGVIYGYVATKNESVAESLRIIRDEIDKIHKSGITKEELADSQDYLIGSFPLRMTKNANLAAFISSMQYENLGQDFLEKRNSYIKAVDMAGINAAAERYFDSNKMLMVIVGKTK